MSVRVSVWRWVLLAVVASGIYFRVAEFTANRSLWLDEAALANNLLSQPTGELARGRLASDQSAPPGFLFAVRAVMALFGTGEQALRLVPLLAGIGALMLFGHLAWEKLGRCGALAATALMAWSPPLIYYSNELKQYSTEVFVGVLIFALAAKFLGKELNTRHAVTLSISGAAALAFSQAAVFMLAALGMTGGVVALRQGRQRDFARWATVSIIWAIFFLAVFGYFYASTFGNEKLFAYYQGKFLQIWPLAALVEGLRDGLFSSWALATSDAFAIVWLAPLLLGVWAERKNNAKEVIFIILAVALTLLTSAWQIYPLVPRLLLFLMPLLFWLLARGVDGLAALGQGRVFPVMVMLVGVALWPTLRYAMTEARHPLAREHLRPVVARLAEEVQPNDLILVWDYTRHAFVYYWPRFKHADATVQVVLVPDDVLISPEAVAQQLHALTSGHDRVWLIVTHYEYGAQPENLRAFISTLRQEYPRAADFVPADGTARGFVFAQPGVPAPAGVTF